jgi:hypothetical protein
MTGETDTQRDLLAPPQSACSTQLSGILDAVRDLNVQVLEALASSAQSRATFPLSGDLRAPLASLSSSQRKRGVRCGVLLADAGFSDLPRWQRFVIDGDYEPSSLTENPWLPMEEALALSSAVLHLAWHVVRVLPSLAGVLLGMPAPVLALYRRLGVSDLVQIARRRAEWIRPRWVDRRDVWAQIIDEAGSPSSPDSAAVVLRCLKVSAITSTRVQASVDTYNS